MQGEPALIGQNHVLQVQLYQTLGGTGIYTIGNSGHGPSTGGNRGAGKGRLDKPQVPIPQVAEGHVSIGGEPGSPLYVHHLQSIRGGPDDQLKGYHRVGIIHKDGHVSGVPGLRGSPRPDPEPRQLNINKYRSTTNAHLVSIAVGIGNHHPASLKLNPGGDHGIGVHQQQQDFSLSG
ncbi:hypothetical protein ES703_81194 [subsurface metagenome]